MSRRQETLQNVPSTLGPWEGPEVEEKPSTSKWGPSTLTVRTWTRDLGDGYVLMAVTQDAFFGLNLDIFKGGRRVTGASALPQEGWGYVDLRKSVALHNDDAERALLIEKLGWDPERMASLREFRLKELAERHGG